MSKPKIIALIAVISFALAMTTVGNAVAGETVKCRTVKYNVKFEPIEVGDVEGHMLGAYEVVGIVTNLEGKPLYDGWAYREKGLLDFNVKTGVGAAHGYSEFTDKDGDKIYGKFEGKMIKGIWKGGTWSISKGTGKFVGITGGGTWYDNVSVAPKQSYVGWEGEVELP